MIEINLVPDIKQELIRAQRVRATVISFSIIIGIGAAGVVVALCLWVFGVQTALGAVHDSAIKASSEEISKIDDLSNALTLQNQLTTLPGINESKIINSRLFSVLTTINPPAPNDIQITTATIDAESTTITIEGQAAGGFSALETFRKTIGATNVALNLDGETQTMPLASDLADIDRSFGEDAEGNKVVRFTISFVYATDLFSPLAKNVRVQAPTKSNATDSFLGVPSSLFTTKAADINKGEE